MDPRAFYQRMNEAAGLPPVERHRHLSAIHAEVVAEYQGALQKISPEQAGQPAAEGKDDRTLAQVVGHIAAWEQFAIQSCGDILAGVRHPRMITTVEGFIDQDGQTLDFPGIDAFNAYHAQQQGNWAWVQVQALALDTAGVLLALFTGPRCLTAERLERTLPFRKRLQNGTVLQDIRMGWNLWITVLEHEAVEHAQCLQEQPS